MSELVLRRAEVRVMLWHLCAYGLAAILESAGVEGVRVAWSGGMGPRPVIHVPSLGEADIAQIVIDHATRCAAHDSWVSEDVVLSGSPRGLMSPRITPLRSPDVRSEVQLRRHQVLDKLTADGRSLDLRLLAALGEPAYWSFNRQGELLQDDGASRLEMQPRNQGSEFVGSRLRKLAVAVSGRSLRGVADGLTGSQVRDEVGGDRDDSRRATGFASPGPTDNAVAWCALWGISQLPISARVNGPTVTSGHLGRARSEWFFAPCWTTPLAPARLRSILASSRLAVVASHGLPDRWSATDADVSSARAWLRARGVLGVLRFPIERFGSDSAPERRAMLGLPLRTSAM